MPGSPSDLHVPAHPVRFVTAASLFDGHVEYFTYLRERLVQAGAGHVQVFGGGGGVIVPEEIALLAERGVTIFSPDDGARLGLPGMINELIRSCDVDLTTERPDVDALLTGDPRALARTIT